MAKYSVPGIRFKEVDNTLRDNATASLGVGAIVFKSNKGPVNQRVLANTYNQFVDVYGEPEELDDYGHFAAQNFLQNSTSLLCVRATMGDEEYAQIQYPYTDSDADSTCRLNGIAEFKFTDNSDANNLELIENLEPSITISAYEDGDAWIRGTEDNGSDTSVGNMVLSQYAQFGTVYDLISDNASAVAVFKSKGTEMQHDNIDSMIEASGQYIEFATKIGSDGEYVKGSDDFILTEDAWTSGSLSASNFEVNNQIFGVSGKKVTFAVPGNDMLNTKATQVSVVYNLDFAETIQKEIEKISKKEPGDHSLKYTDLFNDDNFYKGQYQDVVYCKDPVAAAKISFIDWDDCTNKTYYVALDAFKDTVEQAVGVTYREFGMAEYAEDLMIFGDGEFAPKIKRMDTVSFEKINKLADEYGTDAAEIASKKYALLTYYRVNDGYSKNEDYQKLLSPVEKIVYVDDKMMTCTSDMPGFCGRLFYIYKRKNENTAKTISIFTADEPNLVVMPWQRVSLDGAETINKMTAFPSSEVLNSTNETYKDGYTLSIESDDEPGNGDIEQYVSNKSNQLIIAARGPGKYGNDIGVSIITTACADVKALNHQNAFNWKYRYDDEDQVEKDADELTWKKVYRINVYAKTKTQTAEGAWGFGMDALLKDPLESWYVSNDPTAKDQEGNSLFAPNVINGHSEYIYVSRSSVTDAMTGAGTYAQPRQTYAIYQLTGGSNSKKNNMTEKTAALKLYQDRQKANFDILFNVEAVDTFNGRQRYAAHQRRIAEIASTRTMDIGVVQVTSKEAKSAKRQLSDGKMFSFNNGTYVACYAGYDKYYNDTLASWIYLPRSVAGACAMAYCDNYAYPWMAPAGVARGGIQYSSGPLTRLTDDEIGQLYDANINTARLCGGYGECLWGQKTALKKESALNRINVRRCLNFIEKQMENMMTPFLFQQNTASTRSSARNTIDSFLARVKAAQGLESYTVSVTQDSEDPHIMNVNIRVIPAECIEFISVTINVDRNSGISTEEG